MHLLQTLIFTTMILQASYARYRRPRPNMMALQNMLSPNAERMVKMPQRQCNTCNLPVQYQPLPETNNPLNQPLPQILSALPNVPLQYQNPAQILPSPTPIQLQNPAQIPSNPGQMQPNPTLLPPVPLQPNPQIQLPAQIQSPYPAQIPMGYQQIPAPPNQPKPTQIQQTPQVLPNMAQIQMPAPNLPEIVLEKPIAPCACQREIIYPSPEITTNLFSSPPITSIEPVPLTPNQDIYGCPIPSPASLFNPLLPAASPVSAWTQEVPPEPSSYVRSQFLRKIPIPPPTL